MTRNQDCGHCSYVDARDQEIVRLRADLSLLREVARLAGPIVKLWDGDCPLCDCAADQCLCNAGKLRAALAALPKEKPLPPQCTCGTKVPFLHTLNCALAKTEGSHG